MKATPAQSQKVAAERMNNVVVVATDERDLVDDYVSVEGRRRVKRYGGAHIDETTHNDGRV